MSCEQKNVPRHGVTRRTLTVCYGSPKSITTSQSQGKKIQIPTEETSYKILDQCTSTLSRLRKAEKGGRTTADQRRLRRHGDKVQSGSLDRIREQKSTKGKTGEIGMK